MVSSNLGIHAIRFLGHQNQGNTIFSVLAVIQHLLAAAPGLIVANLYLFSWRAQSVLGYWPEPMNPDPKFVADQDALSWFFYFAVYPLFILAHLAFVALPIVSLLLYRRLPRWWTFLLFAAFVVGFLVFRADPGERFYWWQD